MSEFSSKSMNDYSKTKRFQQQRQGGGKGKVLDDEKFDQVQRESSKLAVEVSHGIVVEALKSAMFAQ